MQDSGTAAIELNIYYLHGDAHIRGRDVEQRHLDILARVKDAVTVPVAVKLSPYFSATGEMARRLDEARCGRACSVQPIPAARYRPRDPHRGACGVVVHRGGDSAAAEMDCVAARAGRRIAGRDRRRRGRRGS